MIKLVKIIGIILGLGIYPVFCENYNVITVARGTTSLSYNRLEKKEVYFVFAQLARSFTDKDADLPIPESYRASWDNVISQMPKLRFEREDIPTIIVFNEAFFGQDKPLSKKEVDEIIDIYKKFQPYMPKAYLFINFLYTDVYTEDNKDTYDPQIAVSKKRYDEILTIEGGKTLAEIMQPSFIFNNRIQDCIDEENLNEPAYNENEKGYLKVSKEAKVEFGQSLFFNQTKIFSVTNEIGYYNKSSFFKEVEEPTQLGDPKEKEKRPFYVIGDFQTQYDRPDGYGLPIACLTCYDIDVIANEEYQERMPRTCICVFLSNTSASLPLTLNVLQGKGIKLSNFYICADSKSETEGKTISGVFSRFKSYFENCLDRTVERKNIFHFKYFLLTNKSIVERVGQ